MDTFQIAVVEELAYRAGISWINGGIGVAAKIRFYHPIITSLSSCHQWARGLFFEKPIVSKAILTP